ncbi:hypothetical protein CYMTET_20480 [Cymbomonas tetramitiformis]|uniref:Uncharacterized protein n=1 Tax=Cymbomonas tetramitiformis TaxID=36881 RepID=A0AAE0G4N3_9CHLO|nr:hypothetical protein CYMTET_20480 [Cymbomonas tetramitiformis]
MADPADDPELDATPVPSAIDVRRCVGLWMTARSAFAPLAGRTNSQRRYNDAEDMRNEKRLTGTTHYDYESDKGQLLRERELARFTTYGVTVLTDYNPLFGTVFDLTDVTAPICREASRLLFRLFEVLFRGSALRLLEASAQVSPADGRKVFLLLCRTGARRRRLLVSHGYIFEGDPPIYMLAGVDPKPHVQTFRLHYAAVSRETVTGLSVEAIWGVGVGIIDLLARRMCPEYYKDFLTKYDRNMTYKENLYLLS